MRTRCVMLCLKPKTHFVSNIHTELIMFINLGLYRTGTTSLAALFEGEGVALRDLAAVDDLSDAEFQQILVDPASFVRERWSAGLREQIFAVLNTGAALICDGIFPLLAFHPSALADLEASFDISRLCTHRAVPDLVDSNSSTGSRLTSRSDSRTHSAPLSRLLEMRARAHASEVSKLANVITPLPLESAHEWPTVLNCAEKPMPWMNACTFKLPLLGVLLTFRHKDFEAVKQLVLQLKRDALARILIVIATDSDDEAGLRVRLRLIA